MDWVNVSRLATGSRDSFWLSSLSTQGTSSDQRLRAAARRLDRSTWCRARLLFAESAGRPPAGVVSAEQGVGACVRSSLRLPRAWACMSVSTRTHHSTAVTPRTNHCKLAG